MGEKLVVKRETGNRHDEFAVAVEKDEEIVDIYPNACAGLLVTS